MTKTKPGVIRTTFDFAAAAAHLADEITKDANLSSRWETVERTI